MVVVPNGSPRGLLVHVLNLAFPIGLVIIALRLLLRMILVVSGHDSVEVEGELVPGAAGAALEDAPESVIAPAEATPETPEDYGERQSDEGSEPPRPVTGKEKEEVG